MIQVGQNALLSFFDHANLILARSLTLVPYVLFKVNQ